MSYESWMTGIYCMYDAMFKHYELEDENDWLISKIPFDELFDADGNYKFKPKDEYEGYERSKLTGSNRRAGLKQDETEINQ